jgi:hypothetical protein
VTRVLYFDIDGTLVRLGNGEPKPALVGGRFEAAVRRAGIEDLVCVGGFVEIVQYVRATNPEFDGVGAFLRLCPDVIRDEAWFRSVVRLVQDPPNRAAEIALDRDWYYADDLAESYLRKASLEHVFTQEQGRRILVPEPDGDGEDLLRWLGTLGARAA